MSPGDRDWSVTPIFEPDPKSNHVELCRFVQKVAVRDAEQTKDISSLTEQLAEAKRDIKSLAKDGAATHALADANSASAARQGTRIGVLEMRLWKVALALAGLVSAVEWFLNKTPAAGS